MKADFENSRVWPTAKRLRELLFRAQIPLTLDPAQFPALHQLAAEKNNMDAPDVVTWVRNRLVHPQDPHDRLYARDTLVVEAWQLSREYICLLVLHAIGYRGGYLSPLPPQGWLGAPARVPWAGP